VLVDELRSISVVTVGLENGDSLRLGGQQFPFSPFPGLRPFVDSVLDPDSVLIWLEDYYRRSRVCSRQK